MVNANPTEKSMHQLEEELISRVAELSYIVNGLEGHEPYQKMVASFLRTRESIDANWHLISDPLKLQELRVTKYAVEELINYIPNAKADLERCQLELGKLQNPDDVVNKDYDPE